MDLSQKKCVPCEGGVPKLSPEDAQRLLARIQGWTIQDGKLHKKLRFKDFLETMAYVQKLALIAESEGHHPDFFVHYGEIEIWIVTHAIGGLSENDFILAAKLDLQ